ncbi:uncharacterized protein PRCAT00001094001 [Priceomyces carsonii]|uniref:uncharacterized protein n=1 Tax=Priceomyces carsonii TaxID=28549 RepID=UPI002EDA57B1|nr:unnamed protein product [Priceomyces carsonii]
MDSRTSSLAQAKSRRKSTSSSSVRRRESMISDPATIKRRSSSFASTSSPWFKRNSLLSPAMIQNENFSVYESSSFYSSSSSYNIISLKECQGFIFNQDLFASPYQQLKSLANERKYQALSFSKSRSNSSSRSQLQSQTRSKLNSPSSAKQGTSAERRHTSYHDPKPPFFISGDENAIADDDDSIDVYSEPSESEQIDDFNNALVDEYNEYEESVDYGGDATNRTYKVCVTEIIVNENDNSIFPT